MYTRWKIRKPVRTRVVRWGNSLGLRVPEALAEEVDVHAGSAVEISLARDQLIVRRAPTCFELDDLLGEVTPENLHAEVTTGEPRGSES
jgi:antitoxin MazE